MGISDRDYARYDAVRRRPPLARMMSLNGWLIIINVVIFFADPLLGGLGLGIPVYEGVQRSGSGAALVDQTFRMPNGDPAEAEDRRRIGQELSRAIVTEEGQVVGREVYTVEPPLRALGHFSTYLGFQRIEVWRLVTFQFLHANFLHLFFNMFGLWVFGSMAEEYLGRKRYAAFYLVCGIFGGLAYLLLSVLEGVLGIQLPGRFENLTTPLIGASAGVFGVIMASAHIAPNAIVQLLFPPIPLKLKWFAYGYVGISFFALINGSNNAGGEAAHMGGAIAGFFFIRNAHLLRDFFDVFADSRKPREGKAREPRRARGAPSQSEVDRILAKVGTQGLQSLTEQEKKTLREATEAERRPR